MSHRHRDSRAKLRSEKGSSHPDPPVRTFEGAGLPGAWVPALLCATLAAGCRGLLPATQLGAAGGPNVPAAGEPSLPPPTRVRVDPLLSAIDEAPEEVARLLRPERSAERVRTSARYRFGIRGGVLFSGGAERRWRETIQYGLYLRRAPASAGRVALELAADYAAPETTDGARSSKLCMLHADLLLGRFGSRGARFYFTVGGQAILGESTNNVTTVSGPERGGGAEVGLGLGAENGRWDIRGTYTLFLTTLNISGSFALSLGFAF